MSKKDKKGQTCGPMYKEALDLYAGSDAAMVRIFAAGFVSGQAEKVYLGACRAAMFRPSPDRFGMLVDVVDDVVSRYGLRIVLIESEIWICRAKWLGEVKVLNHLTKNSEAWHERRAWLCGIPKKK